MSDKIVDSHAVNAFVASAKMDETSFSRVSGVAGGGGYGQTRGRIEEMEEEYDAQVGKVDKYLSKSLVFAIMKFIYLLFVQYFQIHFFGPHS